MPTDIKTIHPQLAAVVISTNEGVVVSDCGWNRVGGWVKIATAIAALANDANNGRGGADSGPTATDIDAIYPRHVADVILLNGG